MTEKWKPIRGYEDEYEISNYGRVKSINFRNNIVTIKRDKILKPQDNGNGYLLIALKKSGKRKNKYIHRLVADAFIDNPNDYDVVNHIDYNKKNNIYSNLEWVTQIDNIKYSIKNMKKPHRCKTNTGFRYITSRKRVYRIIVKGIEKHAKTIEEALIIRGELLGEFGISISD